MTKLKQKVSLNENGIGYYVVERQELDGDGNVINVPSTITPIEEEIVRLRLAYVPFSEIAKQLDIDVNSVKKKYYATMSRDFEQVAESMNIIRYEELLLLENQIKHCLEMQKSMPDNLEIVDKIISVLNRRSKLLGLDAPERFQAQVQVSSFEDQLKLLDAEYVEVIENAVNKEYKKRNK